MFAVLGLVGVASAVSLPFNEDFEGFSLGTLDSNGWTTATNGNWIPTTIGGPMDIVGGGPNGANAAQNPIAGSSYYASSVPVNSVASGVVDIYVNLKTDGHRSSLVAAGDGNAGNASNRSFFSITFFSAYDYAPYSIVGQGNELEGLLLAQGIVPPDNDWVDVHIELDMDTPSLMVEWEDIDDTTGASLGTGWTTVLDGSLHTNGGLPFLAFDYFEIGGKAGNGPNFDNIRMMMVPEPTTLSMLVMGAGLALLRRRHYVRRERRVV